MASRGRKSSKSIEKLKKQQRRARALMRFRNFARTPAFFAAAFLKNSSRARAPPPPIAGQGMTLIRHRRKPVAAFLLVPRPNPPYLGAKKLIRRHLASTVRPVLAVWLALDRIGVAGKAVAV
jgi:hypothetical protein